MITTKDLVGGLGRNLDIIRAQTKDLSHADSLLQPPFRGNCLNWVLGHIADTRNGMLQSLGQEPILSAAQYAKPPETQSFAISGTRNEIQTHNPAIGGSNPLPAT